MTVVQYTTISNTNPEDGRVYGSVSYAGELIASRVTGDPEGGFKTHDAFSSWARDEAYNHKLSITPAATDQVTRSFSL